MSQLWNFLKGKKTYVLAMSCIGTIVLKAIADQLEGVAVDWPHVAQEIIACLMMMAVRHSVGQALNGFANGTAINGKPATTCLNGPCSNGHGYRDPNPMDR